MSTPNTISPSSNLQLVSEKEDATLLESYIDSVVMEGTAQRSGLETQQFNESNDVLNIGFLPDEIIVEVFGYLKQNQLGQIARVCRRWNVLTKSPSLWKNANVDFSASHGSRTTVARSFVNGLPSCVTSIRLDFMKYSGWTESLDFHELCLKLQEKCPDLEELILINSLLSNNLSSVICLCSQFLQDIKKLIFQDCTFDCDHLRVDCFDISKIKILELLNCFFQYCRPDCYNESPFSKLPHLEQLHLFKTIAPDSWFEDDVSFLNQLQVLNVGCTLFHSRIFSTIQNHGHNLKELYLCTNHSLQDRDFTFTNSVFPHLKTICLNLAFVTCEGVVSLIQSCPSLENVYVSERVAESFAVHPFVVANRCKAGIVKAIDEIHNHTVDYSHT